MADLTVITLTRNHPEYIAPLDDALGMAISALPPDLRVQKVLVNNGANVRRKTWDPVTKAAAMRDWAVIEPGRNTSFSEGNNLAVKAASGAWLLLLNDDALLAENALAHLWEARHEAEILGCLIVQSDGLVNHAGTALLPWPHHMGRTTHPSTWAAEQPRVQKVEAVTFACALIRADWYRELGGLNELYNYSFEDTDFCLRTIQRGGRIAVHLDAVVLHDECGTRPRGGGNDQLNAQVYRSTWENSVAEIVRAYRGSEDA